MVEAMKEIERPKVGRKARREGTVEVIETSEDQARIDLSEALAAAGYVDDNRNT